MTEIRQQIHEEAATALERHSDDPEVSQRIEVLLASLGNALSDEAILQELRTINAGGKPSKQ